jgi:hypothetical protein
LGKNTEAERGYGDVYNTEEKDTDGIVFLLIFFLLEKMPKLGRGRDCPRMVPGVRVRNVSSFTMF